MRPFIVASRGECSVANRFMALSDVAKRGKAWCFADPSVESRGTIYCHVAPCVVVRVAHVSRVCPTRDRV